MNSQHVPLPKPVFILLQVVIPTSGVSQSVLVLKSSFSEQLSTTIIWKLIASDVF
jgi:hypothetical protein